MILSIHLEIISYRKRGHKHSPRCSRSSFNLTLELMKIGSVQLWPVIKQYIAGPHFHFRSKNSTDQELVRHYMNLVRGSIWPRIKNNLGIKMYHEGIATAARTGDSSHSWSGLLLSNISRYLTTLLSWFK